MSVAYGQYTGDDNIEALSTRRTITPTTSVGTIGAIWIMMPDINEQLYAGMIWDTLATAGGSSGNYHALDGSCYNTADLAIEPSGSNFIVGYHHNRLNQVYNYMILGADLSNFNSGSYVGNSTHRTITLIGSSFTPKLILISGQLGNQTLWTSSIGGDATLRMDAPSAGWLSNMVESTAAGSFNIGSDFVLNTTNTTYYYACFDHQSPGFHDGLYLKDGVDNRTIATGAEEQGVQIIPIGNGITGTRRCSLRIKGIAGDKSVKSYTTQQQANFIQKVSPDIASGFEVGNDQSVNSTTVGNLGQYHWIGLAHNATAPTLPAGGSGGRISGYPFMGMNLTEYQKMKVKRQLSTTLNNVKVS